MRLKFILFAALSAALGSVLAQPYVGAGAGSVAVDSEIGSASRAAPSLEIGYRWRYAAIEAGYVGEVSVQRDQVLPINATTGTMIGEVVKVGSAPRVSVIGALPIGHFSALARASVYRPEVSTASFSQTERKNPDNSVTILASSSASSAARETLVGFGLGASYRFDGGPLSVRAAADRYKSNSGSIILEVRTFEVLWSF